MRRLLALTFPFLMVLTLACTEQSEPRHPPLAKPTGDSPPPSSAAAVAGRLVILGFDGVDPVRVQRLIDRGKLPHIKKLGEAGHRGPLATTNPPQSPVAWAAFATGRPAGEHGVFDFIGRYPQNYFPKIATTKISHAEHAGGVTTPARAENLRRGDSFWDVIARAGHQVLVLSVPYAYPPPADGARALAGLGTPDLRGTNSTFTLLSADPKKASAAPPAGGVLGLLRKAGFGRWQGILTGPRITVEGKKGRVELVAAVTVRLAEKLANAVEVEVGDQRFVLGPQKRSRYLRISFSAPGLEPVLGATRVTYRRGAPKPELFFEPISLVPEAPYLPVSTPPSFATELWRDHGAFKTVGWVHDTSALGGSVITEKRFLADAQATMELRADVTAAALKKGEDKVVISVFTAPDRIGHMFYRYIDKKHSAPTPGDKARFAGALDRSYEWMDAIVGRLQKELAPEDTLVLMSDHGFGSYRRGFHLNRWLVQAGYLHLKPGVKVSARLFRGVDWSKTKAYALGTGSIFLNIEGREGKGIVPAKQAAGLARQISTELKGLKDGPVVVVKEVFIGDELYAGPRRPDAPDLRVALAPGYRASWATALGGVPQGLFNNNTKKWSGDHASNHPDDVPGFVVASRPLGQGKTSPRIEDIAATAYAHCGMPVPAGVVGSSLF